MASKELIEKVAKAINGPFCPVPEGSLFTLDQLRDIRWQQINEMERKLCLAGAEAAISTIRAALQEPTEAMLEAGCDQYDFGSPMTQGELLGKEWNAMLHASALGEQSDGE